MPDSAGPPVSDGDALLPVARRLLGAGTAPEARDVVVRALFERTDADECAFAVLEDGTPVSRASVTTGLIDAPEGPLADEFGLIERSHAVGEPLVVADLLDVRRDRRARDPDIGAADSEGPVPYRSILCVPLEQGVLVATADRPGAFDRGTRRTAEGIASLAEDALAGLRPPAASGPPPEPLERAVSTLTHEMMDKLMIANSRLEAARESPDPERFDELAAVHDRIEAFTEEVARYIRTGERVPDRERIDLEAAAERAWRLVEAPDVELRCPDRPEIIADGEMLSELLENLFRNCAEHGFPDDRSGAGTKVVRVGRLGARAGFYVEDNGQGIDPKQGASVFDPGTTTAADGSGHGLCICRGVASAHGWAIDATDAADGGARFEITGVEFAADCGGGSDAPTPIPDTSRGADRR